MDEKVNNAGKGVYKHLYNPAILRKNALDSALITISLLERYESYKTLRKKKHLYLNDLRKTRNN